jgi:hypothetical protein
MAKNKGSLLFLIIANYAILIVGAASSRDHAMMAKK